MHPARRCTNCNNTATKFLGMIVLDPFIPTELDRMEGYFCNNCFSRRLNAYAMDSITSRLKPPPKRSHKCKYCDKEYLDPGILQTHQDLMHSNENEAGITVLEDPAKRAQEILSEDSKRWAAEYVTPPLDTPPEKAKKLRDQLRELNERLDRGDYNKDKDRIWEMFEQKGATTTEERHKRIVELAQEWGIERLRKAAPLWAEFAKKQAIREGWLENKPPVIPPERMHGLAPEKREQLKEQVLKCDQCPMVFYSKTALANHRRAHERRKRGRPRKE